MKVNFLVLKYEGTKTENEIYQVIIEDLNQMVFAVGNNVGLLEQLRIELSDKLALTINRLYHAKRQEQQITDEVDSVLNVLGRNASC